MASDKKQDPRKEEITPEKGNEEPPLPPKEVGGTKGLEPTRYGDWERKGLISDFFIGLETQRLKVIF